MGHLSRIDRTGLVGHQPRNRAGSRTTIQENDLGLIEDSYVSPYMPPPSGHEGRHQIVVPYHGFFAYCVGTKRWLMDSNSLLLISPGWDFHDEHVVPDVGHAALLVTPPIELIDEICRENGLTTEAAFRAPSRTAPMALVLLAHALRGNALFGDELERDELLLRLIREAVCGTTARTSRESRIVRRAKEILHSAVGDRLTLSHIAGELGVTAPYLTQEFSRVEGIPLYRYQLRLRLNQALAELARCDDITGLALDLGFCSHSHFTSAFRSTFGLTPSEYRAAAGVSRLAASPPFPN